MYAEKQPHLFQKRCLHLVISRPPTRGRSRSLNSTNIFYLIPPLSLPSLCSPGRFPFAPENSIEIGRRQYSAHSRGKKFIGRATLLIISADDAASLLARSLRSTHGDGVRSNIFVEVTSGIFVEVLITRPQVKPTCLRHARNENRPQ